MNKTDIFSEIFKEETKFDIKQKLLSLQHKFEKSGDYKEEEKNLYYFYISFYQNEKHFIELEKILKEINMLIGKHKINSLFFLKIIRDFYEQYKEENR